MLDANFCLKSKDRNVQDDPSLGTGLAYYVEEGPYQTYLKDCPEQTEVSVLSYIYVNQLSLMNYYSDKLLRFGPACDRSSKHTRGRFV